MLACTCVRADVTLLCLLAQVCAAACSTTLKMPDQEVRRSRRGSDERGVEGQGKVEVNVFTYTRWNLQVVFSVHV